jgi:hypothetical protein
MNILQTKIVLWSSRICLYSFIIWLISCIGIALTSPLCKWESLSQYVLYYHHTPRFFTYLSNVWMILFSLSFMILAIVWEEFSTPESKIISKIGGIFAILFAICSCLHYFVQISEVRFALNQDQLSGLEHFLQANPTSFSSSVNILGWTLFLGISCLCFSIESTLNKRSKWIKTGLLILAFSCLVGCFSFLVQVDILTFQCVNLGLGGGMILLLFFSFPGGHFNFKAILLVGFVLTPIIFFGLIKYLYADFKIPVLNEKGIEVRYLLSKTKQFFDYKEIHNF